MSIDGWVAEENVIYTDYGMDSSFEKTEILQ